MPPDKLGNLGSLPGICFELQVLSSKVEVRLCLDGLFRHGADSVASFLCLPVQSNQLGLLWRRSSGAMSDSLKVGTIQERTCTAFFPPPLLLVIGDSKDIKLASFVEQL